MSKSKPNTLDTGETKGPADLVAEVFDRDRCAICGACVGRCPYFVHDRGRVVMPDRCTLGQGRCYQFCPMAGARGEFEGDLGPHKEVLIAQAGRSDLRRKGQYGGTVSALIWLAIREGLIDEAVLTLGLKEHPPKGVRVRTRQQVMDAAGSRYSASGAVAELNRALAEDDNHPLGLVGTPCQIKAAAAMRRAKGRDLGFKPNRIKLLVGLFCTWALDYRRLNKYLRFMLFGERAFGYDIPPPPADVFKVITGDGIKAFPLCEIRPLRLNACSYCDDMTAVMADVSVGSVEGLEGWNTVIVRTKAGADLVKLAESKKFIKTARLPVEDLEHLSEAAGMKKERAARAWLVDP